VPGSSLPSVIFMSLAVFPFLILATIGTFKEEVDKISLWLSHDDGEFLRSWQELRLARC
jgi:hypothetical protein